MSTEDNGGLHHKRKIQFKIPVELHEKIKDICKGNNISQADFVRGVINKFIEFNKDKLKR